MRENILNGKHFIKFSITGNSVETSGQILGEAADGWFYVNIEHVTGTGSKKLLPVAELESARFFDSESAMLAIRRRFEKPLGLPPRK